MTYYRVKSTSDQVRVNRLKTDFLIANELKTLTEVTRLNIGNSFLNQHFDKVELSKFKTYFFFGSRFEANL